MSDGKAGFGTDGHDDIRRDRGGISRSNAALTRWSSWFGVRTPVPGDRSSSHMSRRGLRRQPSVVAGLGPTSGSFGGLWSRAGSVGLHPSRSLRIRHSMSLSRSGGSVHQGRLAPVCSRYSSMPA